MAHEYLYVNSFRESENQVCMKHEDYYSFFFFVNFNCLSLVVFFSLKLVYGGSDGAFLQYMSVTPLN